MARALAPRLTLAMLAFVALASCGDDDRPRALGIVDTSVPHGDAAAEAEAGPVNPAVCEPADPAQVEVPPLTTDKYEIVLEGPKLSHYEGLVRALEFHHDHAPLIGDFAVCNGDYENPNISVTESNHHVAWSYDDPADTPKEGYVVNVHALPSTQELSDRMRAYVKKGVRMQVWGFEVDRINYTNGSWWTDAGCNTLLITHVCIGEN